MFDYETLKLIWWVLVGVLLIGFAITDGFDLGAAILSPFVGKTDSERRAVLNTIAPHWDGNQVWLITGAGALFAAWPIVYAVSFSGFYWAMLLVLFALFVRPVGFDYRSKLENTKWRNSWDWALCIGGVVPALVIGVAFGNFFLGVPFRFNDDMRIFYEGNLFGLLNPIGLLVGVVSLFMIISHGATWLMMRTTDQVQQRSRKAALIFAGLHLLTFVIAGVVISLFVEGYSITSAIDPNGYSTPLTKTVEHAGNLGWLNNYSLYPISMTAPIIGILGSLLVIICAKANKSGFAFLGSSLAITGTICTAGFALFPFLLPSSIDFNSSLTMWDAVSSHKTLGIMMFVACLFVPIVLIYSLWSYIKMWGRVSSAHVEENTHNLY